MKESSRKFFLLTYYQSPRDLQLSRTPSQRDTYEWQIGTRPMESQLHKVRDGLASGLLVSFLYEEGYKYGGPILNLPESVADALKSIGGIDHRDDPASASDLLLLATRPPLRDFEDGEPYTKRYILRSQTALEANVFQELQMHFFTECSREHVNLNPGVELPQGHNDLRSISFKESGGAHVAKASAHCGLDETVAYMLSTGPVRPNGPRLLAAFGIGGTETLLLAYLIRTDPEFGRIFRDLLKNKQRRMALAIFKVPSKIPHPYLSYDLGVFRARIVPCQLPASRHQS